MSKKMLINATLPEENRVAIVADGTLTELDIEVAGREQTKGNIYRAVVVRVESGLQAAFVDYGAERLGFLQIDEINFKTIKPSSGDKNGRGRPRINDLLHRGQEILVQIVKEERGTKGAALTTFLSLAGRYMVLMPDSNTRGVSRKAENDSQRKQLKKAMASLELPENFGYIVRTAALDKTREELERDSRYLMRLYDSIRELSQKAKAPSLIYRESNLVIRSIRDYFTTDMDEVLIDDPEVYQEAKDFFRMVMPDHANLVKLHQERRPIFSRYQIEDQIETISSNKVNLPSGGSIVIDTTEALVAIDINSGKMAGEQSVEETATKTNLEAATEIGRQLRLRDLGGLIVIDFIDMESRKNIRSVEQKLKESTASDKARINIGRISQFGLLEMSRQRIKATLAAGTYRPCPHCHGAGRIKSPEAMAVNLLRRIHAGVAKGQVGSVDAQLPLEVASYLLNNKREELFELERRYRLQIHIHGRPEYLTEQVEIDFQKREKEPEQQTELVTAGMIQSMADSADTEEKPAEKSGESAESSDKSAAGGEQKSGQGRKRRRRGGRKRSSGGEAKPAETDTGTADAAPAAETAPASSEGAPAASEQISAPADHPSQPETAEAAAAPEPASSSGEEGGKPAPKPRSRGRRGSRGGRRKSESQAGSSPAEAAEQSKSKDSQGEREANEDVKAPAADQDVSSSSGDETSAKSNSTKPKSRGRSRSGGRPARTQKSSAAGEQAPAETGSEENAQTAGDQQSPKADEPHSAPGATSQAPQAEQSAKPKPRRRTTRSKSTAKHPAADQTTSSAAEPAASKEDAGPATKDSPQSTEAQPKPKRSTRSRSKTAAAKTKADTAAPATGETASADSHAATEKAAAKPKRRTTSRKTSSASAKSAAADQTGEPAETAESSAKPKSGRSTGTRGRTRKSQTAPADEKASEAPERSKKPRRATRKKTETAEPDPS